MRELPSDTGQQCGVFSTAQAFRSGWTKDQLSYAVRRGRVEQLRRGAYLCLDEFELTNHERARWQHAAPATGAVLVTLGATASHSTAAVLRGMPLLFLPDRACASVPPWLTSAVPRVHVHRCASGPFARPVGQVPCTTAERTSIDLAREHGVAAGVVAMDFALHTGRTDLDALSTDLARCVRWPGVRRAREAVALADGRSESVLETRSRLAMRASGLPDPEPQRSLGNEWGGFVARVDFYWDEFGVIGEADGAVKYGGTDPEPLWAEKKRQEALTDLGLEVVRWGNADLRNFSAVARRLERAFARPRADRRWTVLARP